MVAYRWVLTGDIAALRYVPTFYYGIMELEFYWRDYNERN